MFYSDNPVADFEKYDNEQTKKLNDLPVCSCCGEPIQDDTAYYINDEWICHDCMKLFLRGVE